MNLCEVCGNELADSVTFCPFCRSRQQTAQRPQRQPYRHKVVNLELGLPVVEAALKRLDRAINQARDEHIRQVTLIHGYGSSGKGGAIRSECRKMLDFMLANGEVDAILFGEDFRSHHGPSKELLRRYPPLAKDRNLNKGNRGITLVFL